jgi:hypothetical protein
MVGLAEGPDSKSRMACWRLGGSEAKRFRKAAFRSASGSGWAGPRLDVAEAAKSKAGAGEGDRPEDRGLEEARRAFADFDLGLAFLEVRGSRLDRLACGAELLVLSLPPSSCMSWSRKLAAPPRSLEMSNLNPPTPSGGA